MRPMRRNWGGGGFGGSHLESVAAKLALALVVGSVLSVLSGTAGALLKLYPGLVLERLMVWQPLTYGFVETSPLGVIFGALMTYQMGGALEMTWGSKRLLWVALGCTGGAGLITVLVSLLVPELRLAGFSGGWAMTGAIWVAYGLAMGRGESNFWGIPVTGNTLAAIGAGFVVLNGLFGSFWGVLPDLVAMALAAAYVRGGSPRTLWLRLQHKRLQRQLRGRSRHLRVVDETRRNRAKGDGRDQWLN